jgi:ribosome-binding factor A
MSHGSSHPYPRSARVNEILREVISDELVRAADLDDRLGLLTVTGVQTSPDLRTATVFLDSISREATEALEELRGELQASVNAQTRLKRTPRLHFEPDPAVAAGEAVEEILRRQRHDG